MQRARVYAPKADKIRLQALLETLGWADATDPDSECDDERGRDIAFVDVGLGDAALEHAEHVRANSGHAKIVVCGYPDEEVDPSLSLYADAHLYKPATQSELARLLCALMNDDDDQELVCLFLGLRFYASPKTARILKTKVTDILLSHLQDENLVGIDVRLPPVDMTPTLSLTRRTRRGKRHEQT